LRKLFDEADVANERQQRVVTVDQFGSRASRIVRFPSRRTPRITDARHQVVTAGNELGLDLVSFRPGVQQCTGDAQRERSGKRR
jgi:hypothetical protein